MGKEDSNKRPEWVPDESGDEFTSFVMPGIKDVVKVNTSAQKRRAQLGIDDYVNAVLEGNRSILARTITLVESNSDTHISRAQQVLKQLLPHTGKSIRIGITGAPGAGKSTFIEAFGKFLCDQGHKVAVLAIDPSSTLSRGSILGDKTRMETLSREKNAFIRPSPSGGTLGGVARKTRETALVCEAAGFDIILIETVGVGQSETTVRSMVDMFILMLLPGGGDELQGIKKGTVELSDTLIVNKADGKNRYYADMTADSYRNALHLLKSYTEGWIPKVQICSAIEKKGIREIWETVQEFIQFTREKDIFETRRKKQMLDWVYSMVDESLKHWFYNNPEIKNIIPEIEKSVISGDITATNAVLMLTKLFREK